MIGPRKLVGLFVVLALVAAACGGGDESSTDPTSAPTSAPSDSENNTPTTGATTPPPEDGGSEAQGDNTAVVTIGTNRYEFDMTPGNVQRCDPDFFGAFWGIGVSSDGGEASLNLLLPPEGDPNFEDPPSVTVNDQANDLDWQADPEFVASYAQLEGIAIQVDSWTIDGNTASGAATFLDANAAYAFVGGTADAPELVQGTFEISCAGS
jgi:hypothetical protein